MNQLSSSSLSKPQVSTAAAVRVREKSGGKCPFHFDRFESFGPSMPIVDGKVQIPSVGTILRRLFLPTPPAALPALKRADIGLSQLGPKGELVEEGNQWPQEAVHPQFPEFKALSGVEKEASIGTYAHLSRRVGKLEPLGSYGLTANPQIIVDPVGMRWPFEAGAQTAAAYPREKNMHGRGTWGQIEVVPNPDPSKRLDYGILGHGGQGDFRMSLGADQTTNVVGGALGIPLSPNAQGVESANLLMLSGPGPQLDDLDYFARPLSTVALPNHETPTQFKVLDHLFKASAESGVRPGNHMFRYDQEGHYDADAAIPAEVRLVPNPELSLHKLAPLSSLAVDGVKGEAVREKFDHVQGEVDGQPVKVLDLALSECLVESKAALAVGQSLDLDVVGADGVHHALAGTVAEQNPDGTRVHFENPDPAAEMAIYQSMDLLWEISRRVEPGQELYRVDVRPGEGQDWRTGVATVKAKSEFFPNDFADHQRLYAHTERPNSTPLLRKVLLGIRFVTGNIAEGLAALAHRAF